MRHVTWLIIGLMAFPPALAEEKPSFGSDWEPRPLLADPAVQQTTVPATAVTAPAAATVSETQRIEEMLKPVEPFIVGVEKQLGVVLSADNKPTRQERLNHIQEILFGERIYTDAGDLIARLTEIFPQEAAAAQAQLQAELRETVLKPDKASPAMASAQPARKAAKAKKKKLKNGDDDLPPFGPVGQPGMAISTFQNPQQQGFYNGQATQAFVPYQQSEPYQNSDYERRAQRGEGLRSFGRGLMNLAMIGGSLAGAYYLNRNTDAGSLLPNASPYNNPYYGSTYPNAYNGYPNAYSGYNPIYPQYGGQVIRVPSASTYSPYSPYGGYYGGFGRPSGWQNLLNLL